MKQIARRAVSDMPEADESGDVEFTDWDEVEAFAADVAAFVEGRLGFHATGCGRADGTGVSPLSTTYPFTHRKIAGRRLSQYREV